MNKKAAIISLLLTIFTLVLVSGVVNANLNYQNKNVAAASKNDNQSSPASNIIPTGPNLANSIPAQTKANISANQASQLALQAAGPGEELGSTAELVNFNGEAAYEVKMKDGSSLYIGAVDGMLKYNSITGTNIATATPDEAVKTASEYINDYQPVSIAWANYKNNLVYGVSFQDGSIVLVDRTGNVVAAEKVE
jgi:hypothetical protein